MQRWQNKEGSKNTKGGLSIIHLAGIVMASLVGAFILFIVFSEKPDRLATQAASISSFDAINAVKLKIPDDMKKRTWYTGNWGQKSIGENLWEVTVSDGIWKVSKGDILCSETRRLVSICSENGTAKRYSNLGFCKPLTLCAKK